jgi:GGDEF domain-containing protein
MSGAASLLQDRGSNGALAHAVSPPSVLLKRRTGQRRQMLSFLARADSALYTAKAEGRNRIATA